MKQTAVEWLNEKLISKGVLFEYELLEQAKEMEKEQIIEAWKNGMKSDNGYFGTAEQYYNETFKN